MRNPPKELASQRFRNAKALDASLNVFVVAGWYPNMI